MVQSCWKMATKVNYIFGLLVSFNVVLLGNIDIAMFYFIKEIVKKTLKIT